MLPQVGQIRVSKMAHNASLQTDVVPSTDPALNVANEHAPHHQHHAATAHKNQHDDFVYAAERGAAAPSYKTDDHLHPAMQESSSGGSDIEKGAVGYNVSKNDIGYSEKTPSEEMEHKPGPVANFYRKYKFVFHALLGMLFTGWWIASLILHRVSIGVDYGRAVD